MSDVTQALAVAGLLAAWQVWLQVRLRFSARGRAHRDFRSAALRLSRHDVWLCRDHELVFSRCDRRVAGIRVLIVSTYRKDDFAAIAREGSAPVAVHTYRLTPIHLRVLRRADVEKYTMTGEQTSQPGTLWSGLPGDLRQIGAQAIYAAPDELHELAAQIRAAERWAAKDA
jgi:hypothetical protein